MTRIIVVDDDKAATALFEQVLLMNHYEVFALNESAKTIELADNVHQTVPDVADKSKLSAYAHYHRNGLERR